MPAGDRTPPHLAAIRLVATTVMIGMLAACGTSGGTTLSSGTESTTEAASTPSETSPTGTPVGSVPEKASQAALPSGCPSPPISVQDLIALDADAGPLAVEFRPVFGTYNERAAGCYGDRPVTFKAFVATPEGLGGTSNFVIEPAWIASPSFAVQATAELLGPPAFGVGPFLLAGVRPGEGDPMLRFGGSWVMLTGHFNDAAAETCRASGSNGRIPSTEEAMAICRATFVLDAIEPAIAP